MEQPIFMRMREVTALTGVKPAALNNAIRRGKFPRPFLIGVTAKAWSRAEVQRWLEECDAARENYADPACPSGTDG